jgi:hypothetical protein
MQEYKKLLKRKIGFLMEKKNLQERKKNNRFSFFSDDKRKEIIVWMWLNGDKDKDQIKELIIDKFHISDMDAATIFYEAFPDGLDLQEEEMLEDLDNTLKRTTNMNPKVVSDMVDSLAGNTTNLTLNQYNINPTVEKQVKLVIGLMLKSRNIT